MVRDSNEGGGIAPAAAVDRRAAVRKYLSVTLLSLLASCQAPPQGEAATQTDSTAMAEAAFAYDSAAFREMTWDGDSLALERGRTVWLYSCQGCHGLQGEGRGGIVLVNDTVRTPSFLQPEWHLAGAPWELRRRIFAGSEHGMPHWGLFGLSNRDIDAVARYILAQLRAGVR